MNKTLVSVLCFLMGYSFSTIGMQIGEEYNQKLLGWVLGLVIALVVGILLPREESYYVN